MEKNEPERLTEVESLEFQRWQTGLTELDRVLGGGVVPGSLILIGGDPGIGKSTLVLQTTERLAKSATPHGGSLPAGRQAGASGGNEIRILYVSGEESPEQTKMRAERLGATSPNLFIVSETNLENIIEDIEKIQPKVAVIDSIQTIYRSELASAPGSVGQVRECGAELLRLSKSKNIAIFLIGHVTKEGAIAGPRTLEHMVDTVLYFEGERHHTYRILRAVKNRFGSTNEIGVFEMRENGLQEVENPSEIFLLERAKSVGGSVVICALEGTRPILLELQALVSPTSYTIPQRVTTGIDYRRLSMLLAVLERRVGLHLGNQDVFVNVAGGIKIEEPAADLGTLIAVASAYKDKPADVNAVIIGEVGLGGEVRAVNQIEKRIKEAEKMGFKRCLVSENNLKGISERKTKIEVIGIKTVKEALEFVINAGR